MEPSEFKQMVGTIERQGKKAFGKVSYDVEKGKPSYAFRRSLFIVKDMKKGEEFTQDNV